MIFADIIRYAQDLILILETRGQAQAPGRLINLPCCGAPNTPWEGSGIGRDTTKMHKETMASNA